MAIIQVPKAYSGLVVVASYAAQIPEQGNFHAEVSNNDALPAHPPLAMKRRQTGAGNFDHTNLLASSNPSDRWVIVHPWTYGRLQGLFHNPKNPLRLSDVFGLQKAAGGLEAIATAFTWGDFKSEPVPAGEKDEPKSGKVKFPVFYAAPEVVTIAYRGLKDEVNRHKRIVQLPLDGIGEAAGDVVEEVLAARKRSLAVSATAREFSSRGTESNHRVHGFD